MPYYHNIFFLFFHQISVLSIFIYLFILYVIISSLFPTFPILLLLLSLLYYLMHLFYLQEFLLDSHQPLHIHLSFIVLTQLNPCTVSPKREKLFYICSLSARIECEPEGEHSTHSDRVTNIGYCLFRGASTLPAANQNLIINVDITLRIVKSLFITAINQSLLIKGIRQFSFEQSVSEWNFLKENRIRTGLSVIA